MLQSTWEITTVLFPANLTNGWQKDYLAKVYLTRATAPLNQTENYDKARDMADDVITNGPYGLLPDFEDVFKTSNNRNMEIMFAFNTYTPMLLSARQCLGSFGNGWMEFRRCKDIMGYYHLS